MNPPAERAWIFEAGAWRPGATIAVTDRAVRYGMAVFETLGVRDGALLWHAEHFALWQDSAATLLGLQRENLPEDAPVLEPADHGVLRLYATAGPGGPADPVTSPVIFALFERLETAGPPDAQSARLHPEPVTPFAHGRKTANYWMNGAAQAAARRDGFDHALLADHDGRLLSAAFGNIFLVLEGELCTPSPALAVRPGVVRSWVMGRRKTREVLLPASRLAEASEIFLTNSRLGVMPLRLGAVASGPVGAALRDEMRRLRLVP